LLSVDSNVEEERFTGPDAMAMLVGDHKIVAGRRKLQLLQLLTDRMRSHDLRLMPEDEARSQRAFAQFEERTEMIQSRQDVITVLQFGNAIVFPVFPGLIESADAQVRMSHPSTNPEARLVRPKASTSTSVFPSLSPLLSAHTPTTVRQVLLCLQPINRLVERRLTRSVRYNGRRYPPYHRRRCLVP
jgi:hypothetical protein